MKTGFAIAFVLCCACVLAPAASAQNLRRGVADAELVVVARPVGLRPLGNELFLHRYETVETLKGDPIDHFTILERKKIADLPRPQQGLTRILCLRPDRTSGLPARHEPYYALAGYRGEQTVVDDSPESRSYVELCRTIVAAERGQSPGKTTTTLVTIAVRGAGPARREATEVLRERPVLRGRITAVGREELLMRAVAETEDVPLKISLASLCAELGAQHLVEALSLSLEAVDDARFTQALGRIARHQHDEEAVEVLLPLIQRAKGPRRGRLMLALGATGTERALTALLRLKEREKSNDAVDAALRAHGSPRALAAVGRDTGRPKDAPHGRK